MKKYLLVYNYLGYDETFTLESSRESYLRHKVCEISCMTEKSIQYTIYKIKDEGIEEYVNHEDDL